MELPLEATSTVLHRFDPRFKILSFALLSWLIATADSLDRATAFIPIVFVISLPALIHFKRFWKLLFFADSFLIIVLTSQIISGQATLALQILLKSNQIILLSIALLTTNSMFELLHALHHLKVPNSLLRLSFLTYRYLHEIGLLLQSTLKSARCRGFNPKTSRFTYRTYASIFTNLLVHSYVKSDRIYKAMLCRGFNGYFPVFRHFKAGTPDFILLATTVLYGAVVQWKF